MRPPSTPALRCAVRLHLDDPLIATVDLAKLVSLCAIADAAIERVQKLPQTAGAFDVSILQQIEAMCKQVTTKEPAQVRNASCHVEGACMGIMGCMATRAAWAWSAWRPGLCRGAFCSLITPLLLSDLHSSSPSLLPPSLPPSLPSGSDSPQLVSSPCPLKISPSPPAQELLHRLGLLETFPYLRQGLSGEKLEAAAHNPGECLVRALPLQQYVCRSERRWGEA